MWFAVVFVLAAVIFTMSQSQETPPPGVGEVTTTTAEVGREIPVLFGKKRIESANVVWYGHVKVKPIKTKGGKK